MVYPIPVWKLENFYLGAHKSEKHVSWTYLDYSILFEDLWFVETPHL